MYKLQVVGECWWFLLKVVRLGDSGHMTGDANASRDVPCLEASFVGTGSLD